VALIGDNGCLTYAELDERSNRLANHLRGLCVGRGSLVGTMLRRSPDSIVALLAILKVGAAYVPFDPAYPQDLLFFMLQDSSPAAMIVQSSVIDAIGAPSFWNIPTVCMERDAGRLLRTSSTTLPAMTGPDDLAYVMYTSGSTGRPKGVMIPHRGVVRLVKDNDYASFHQAEVFLHLAPLTFDACTFEIWGALLNGARLAVVQSIQPSLEEIADAISTNGVTTMWLTAGLFNLMVDHKLDALRSVRQLLAGGDVLSPSHVQKVLHTLPDCRLINGYGPTENTTFTCCYRVPAEQAPGKPIPIGNAIRHTSVHVLDEDLRPVATGAVGQLCVGGRGVALGYLNRDVLTKQKFIADPFAAQPGALMYLSGDLVRVAPDGNLEFLGRADRQVKINGKRVELEEIEETLRNCASVGDAVAVGRESNATTKQIDAYVTARAGHSPTVDELRLHLRARLPDHMIPNTITVLDAFPLLPSGKIDRNALPTPTAASTRAVDKLSLPRTELERALAAIWQSVLGTETIGVDDNFFDLGGTSLQLIEVQERIQQQFVCKLDTVEMFRFSRIRVLAAHISGANATPAPLPGVQQRALRQGNAIAAMRRRAGVRRDVALRDSR
jgi:amino acid adenylation domain-containing protein